MKRFTPEQIDKLDRETLEGMLMLLARMDLPSEWSGHKKQAVLRYIRKRIRDMTLLELKYMNQRDEMDIREFFCEIMTVAGEGYDGYMARREKRLVKDGVKSAFG